MPPDYNFTSAVPDESHVFGAAGPRTSMPGDVDAWVRFASARGIERVICLLEDCTLLALAYDAHFGAENVLHLRIADVGVPTAEQLSRAVAFIDGSVAEDRTVVVHCMAGMGRTSIVLAAWLVRSRGYDIAAVDEALRSTGAIRRLYEKVEWGVISRDDLHALITGTPPNGVNAGVP